MISKINCAELTAVVLTAAVLFHAAVKPARAQSADAATTPAGTAKPSLDYEFFKTRVEPIFLKRRPHHARCYVCHSGLAEGGAPAYLEPLSPGSTNWTEEQSQRIFKKVSLFVVPGDPASSRLLMHPLAPEKGGIYTPVVHRGGRQFPSKDDPDWQTIAEWVRGGKSGSSSKP
jgi:hypothetical protein